MRDGGFQFHEGDLAAFCECTDGSDSVVFWCPGCDMLHSFRVKASPNPAHPVWTWNRSLKEPTFAPSLLCRWDYPPARGELGRLDRVCHSFVRAGRIEFLSDCTHKLAGTTVDLTVPDDLLH